MMIRIQTLLEMLESFKEKYDADSVEIEIDSEKKVVILNPIKTIYKVEMDDSIKN